MVRRDQDRVLWHINIQRPKRRGVAMWKLRKSDQRGRQKARKTL